MKKTLHLNKHDKKLKLLGIVKFAFIVGLFGSGLFLPNWLSNVSNPTSLASDVLPSDINNDGVVNVSDLSLLIGKWGTADRLCDLNNDGDVNIFDASKLISNWRGLGAPIVVAAIGDITYGSNSLAVVNRIKANNPAHILMIGDYDNARSPASIDNILADIDPLYGPKPNGLYSIMHPVAGPTHDISSCTSWAGYQTYWGKDPTQPYSFDIGNWHILALPDVVERYGCGSPSVSSVTTWINDDLTANTNQCTIAYWHQPYFTSTTSGHGPRTGLKPWVEALYNHGVDIVVAGHQNSDFEAFYPQTPTSVRDDARGIQAFVAGTGGQSGYTYSNTAANSITKSANVYGPLIFTLKDGSYDWKFDQAVGSGYSPFGSGLCH
jgi:acid phosphatase type 7